MVNALAKTIREISEQLGISKQAVQQRMNEIDDFRSKYTRKVGNRLEIDDTGVNLLTGKEAVNRKDNQQERKNQQANGDNNNKFEDTLLKQLEVKDNQIAQLQKALDQQQQLQLTTVQENHRLKDQVQQLGGYIDGSATHQETTNENDKHDNKVDASTDKVTRNQQENDNRNVGFWRKLFGGNN